MTDSDRIIYNTDKILKLFSVIFGLGILGALAGAVSLLNGATVTSKAFDSYRTITKEDLASGGPSFVA